MSKYTLPVEGMTCASCVARVEKIVSKFEDVKNVSVNFATEELSFDTTKDNLDLKRVADAVEEYGYRIKIDENSRVNESNVNNSHIDKSDEKDEHYQKLKSDFLLSLVFTIPIFIISMSLGSGWFSNLIDAEINTWQKILLILTTPVIFISGKRFFIIAWNNLKHFSAEMNTLVAIGTGAAYLYSVTAVLFPETITSAGKEVHVYFETAAVIITLILLGRLLEHRSKRKTGGAIKELLSLRPKYATVIYNGRDEKIEINKLQKGMTVLIKPGEKIPADGEILKGESSVDESMLTGESMPVDKSIGSKVIGGSINKTGSFQFKITAINEDSVLGQIIKIVQEAQGSKAPIQSLADKIASIFVPSVIVIAIVTFLSWYFLSPENAFEIALINFVAVLIIACPCALGLATPTAIVVGTGLGAKSGILFKDGETLERANKITTVVFDKTGTITKGKPIVSKVITDGADESEVIKFAAALEKNSEHPIAEAILNYAEKQNIEIPECANFSSLTGSGISGIVEGKKVIVGNKKIMNQASIDFEKLEPNYEQLNKKSQTSIFVSIDGELSGLIAVEDQIKENAAKSIETLKSKGLKTIMLTGDINSTAEIISQRVGISEYIAEVLPDQKSDVIAKIKSENGGIIAMVGDGINDAPALAAADVGIAMGTGTDAAIETAQITLVKGNLDGVIQSIILSKKTITTIKQNLFWAFIYNTIGIPLAAFGLLNPMFAALAMSFSSVSVVTNSLRLKRKK